jgi:hypothetical protein
MTDGNNPWQKIVEPKLAEAMKWCREQLTLKKLTIRGLAVLNFIGIRDVETRLTWFFMGIAGLFAMILIDEWNYLTSAVSDPYGNGSAKGHDAKLQAIASVFGNALGVIGAVFAVYIAIKASSEKEKEDIERIRKGMRISLISAGIYLESTMMKLHQLEQTSPLPSPSDLRSKLEDIAKSFRRVNFLIFEVSTSRLHEIDAFLPNAVSSAASIREIIEAIIGKGLSNQMYSVHELRSELENYIRQIIAIAYCLDLKFPPEFHEKYESLISRAFNK